MRAARGPCCALPACGNQQGSAGCAPRSCVDREAVSTMRLKQHVQASHSTRSHTRTPPIHCLRGRRHRHAADRRGPSIPAAPRATPTLKPCARGPKTRARFPSRQARSEASAPGAPTRQINSGDLPPTPRLVAQGAPENQLANPPSGTRNPESRNQKSCTSPREPRAHPIGETSVQARHGAAHRAHSTPSR